MGMRGQWLHALVVALGLLLLGFGAPRNLASVVGPGQPVVIPAGEPAVLPLEFFRVSSARVRVFRVDPEEVAATRSRFRITEGEIVDEPVWEEVIEFTAAEQRQGWTREIDLSAALVDGGGQVLVVVDSVEGRHPDYREVAWVQVTDLAVDVFRGDEMWVRVTRQSDGEAVAGVQVKALARAQVGYDVQVVETDEEGLARLEGEAQVDLVVTDEEDALVVPFGQVGSSPAQEDEFLWAVATDRAAYDAGSTVRLVGWVRRRPPGVESDLQWPGVPVVGYRAHQRNVTFDSGVLVVDRFGSFSLEMELPDEAGLVTIDLQLPWLASHRVRLTVRRPQPHGLQVGETDGVDGPSERARVELASDAEGWLVRAHRYIGEELSGALVSWRFREWAVHYEPPGWPGFAFGTYPPSTSERRTWLIRDGRLPAGLREEGLIDVLGPDGVGEVPLELEGGLEGRAREVEAHVMVRDGVVPALIETANIRVHPQVYVGARISEECCWPDQEVTADLVVVDALGEAQGGHRIRARLETSERVIRQCVVRSQEVPVACELGRLDPGFYQLKLETGDERTGVAATTAQVHVTQGRRSTVDAGLVSEETLTLLPDQGTYAPGEVARVRVHSREFPLSAVVEVSRGAAGRLKVVRLTEEDPYLEVPLESAMVPAVRLRVVAHTLGAGSRRVARGEVALRIDPGERELSVEVIPEGEVVTPGESFDVVVGVTDRDGEPVKGAQVLVVGAEASWLDRTDFELPDLMEEFYGGLPEESPALFRSRLRVLSEAAGEGPARYRRGGLHSGGWLRHRPYDRPDFTADQPPTDPPPVFFEPRLRTDGSGRVVARIEAPGENVGYRVMAIAVEPSQRFGRGEASLVVLNPISLITRAPRYLMEGDRAELTAVVVNATEEEEWVDVEFEADHLEFLEPSRERVLVPARARSEVRTLIRAGGSGEGIVHLRVSGGGAEEHQSLDLPVMASPLMASPPVREEAVGEGFTVERRYEAFEHEDDVRRTEEGWEIRAGARVQVVVSVTGPWVERLLIRDHLPAGLVPSSAVRTIGYFAPPRWPSMRPYRQRLLVDGVEARVSVPSRNADHYSYVVHARTVGTFVAEPVRVFDDEEEHRLFGESDSEVVRVVP